MTTFFKKFDTIDYRLEGRSKEAMNIVTAVLPRRLNVDKTFVFQRYEVQSGERPEETADRLYKNPDLWWVLMVVNNLISPYLDWRMADEELEEFAKIKYDDINAIHHYVNIQTGKICDEVDEADYRLLDPENLPVNIQPVTNLAYENDLNIERSKIIVINPRYVGQFVDSYIKALEGRN